MYAVFITGGKQYKVQEGDVIFVEKLEVDGAEEVIFDEVLLVNDDNGSVVGVPFVDGAKIHAKVLKNGKGKKIRVFKYKAKKNYRKRYGHRQPYTKLEIAKISA